MTEPARQLLHPAVGFWMVRLVRDGPEVPASIFYCDHEPGLPENKVDQPYLQGQIGTEFANPYEIWEMLEFCEASPKDQRLMITPLPSKRAPRSNRQPGFATAPMALWKQGRARRITAQEHAYQIADLKHALAYRPEAPTTAPKKAIDLMRAPTPF